MINVIILLIFYFNSFNSFNIDLNIRPEQFDVGNLVSTKKILAPWAKKKLAVIVPFRNAFIELLQFVPHMKRFLSNQKIQFHIFVIHQTDNLRFNRGALLNIGYLYTKDYFDYCVQHDVDLLPLNPKLSYEYPPNGTLHVADIFYHPNLEGIVS